MKETQEQESKGEVAAALPYFAVSLQDAFRAFVAVRAKNIPLHRGRTSFLKRTAARLKAKDRSALTSLDILDDALSPAHGDIEAQDRARFVHELRFGMLPAIGYLMPRTEHARPRLIPKEVWVNGKFDWKRAEITGAGWSFTHLQIVMNANFPESRDNALYGEALPELAPFEPSEAERLQWGIPAGERDIEPEPAAPVDAKAPHEEQPVTDLQSKIGRPSHEHEIRKAYEALKPHDGMTNKQLFHAIRELVKERNGLTTDNGLGDSGIQKKVSRFRREEQG